MNHKIFKHQKFNGKNAVTKLRMCNIIYCHAPVTALNKCGCLSPINRLSNRERKKITSTNCNVKYGKRAKSNLSNNFRHVLSGLLTLLVELLT
jgi:hypothetical protein